jgi:3-mercaptopyruvate sulfurtransferase SseA
MKGFPSAYYLKGGWREWIGAKYPTEPRDPK